MSVGRSLLTLVCDLLADNASGVKRSEVTEGSVTHPTKEPKVPVLSIHATETLRNCFWMIAAAKPSMSFLSSLFVARGAKA